MITIEQDLCNPLSQDFYDKTIDSLPLHQLKCTCGRSACLIKYGSYMRTVKMGDQAFRLRVCRVKCSECGRTHALLLSSIVPYSQIPLEVQASIIEHYENKKGFASILQSCLSIDENNIGSLLLRYRKHWQQRLRCESIPLAPPFRLVVRCFQAFSRQFMQIKTTPNLFFPRPT